MSQEVSFSKAIAEVDRQQQQQPPKLHSYASIQKMLQVTYKQVDNIINHVKNEDYNPQGISKFNYYGKRYRFEEEEERMRQALDVPKPEIPKAAKTVQSIQQEPREVVPTTLTEAPESIADRKEFPLAATMPLKYRLVFEKEKNNVALVRPPNEPTFPTKEKIMEAKIHRLQKQVNQLKTSQNQFGKSKSTIVSKVDELMQNHSKKDGKIRLDSYFYDSNSAFNLEYAD